VRGGYATELEACLVFTPRYGEAHELVIGVAQALGTKAGRFLPLNRETLVDTLEKKLYMTKRVRTHATGESIHPVIVWRRAQKSQRKNPLSHSNARGKIGRNGPQSRWRALRKGGNMPFNTSKRTLRHRPREKGLPCRNGASHIRVGGTHPISGTQLLVRRHGISIGNRGTGRPYRVSDRRSSAASFA
jgi:hypothetical protein